MNYTKIRMVFKDDTELYISEDEIVVYQLSGDYKYIEYQNDKEQAHRVDGPAYEWADGGKWWFVNGQRHRADGPAIEWADGSKEWYVNGKEYTKEEFERKFK